MTKGIHPEEEFTIAMQQLSAEAEKKLPISPMIVDELKGAEKLSLAEKIQAMEKSILSQFDRFAGEIDKQLASIRNTESVNQQLFDSLHAELLKYRDNFLHESLQKPFIHDLVYLYDHLNGLCEQLSTVAQEEGKRTRGSRRLGKLENALHSLVEL